MDNILIDDQGDLLCPRCGSRQFSNRRTRGAKLALGVTVGVGALAAPKRMQCLGCREYLKGPPIAAPRAAPAAPVRARAATAPAVTLKPGEHAVVVTGCEWLGPAMISMLNAAMPTLTYARRVEAREALARGEAITLATLDRPDAEALVARLTDNGFTVQPLADEPAAQQDQAAAPAAEPDVLSQLKALGELHDAGVLTDDEFAAKKTELLKRL